MINHNNILNTLSQKLNSEKISEVSKNAFNNQQVDDIEIFEWCLEEHEKRQMFIKGNRNHFITALANFCNEYGVSYQICLQQCLNRYIQDDFKEYEISRTVKNVYDNHSGKHNTSNYLSKVEYVSRKREQEHKDVVAKEFPIEIFPAEIQQFINELKAKKALPHDYICGALLSAFSTAAGKKVFLKHDNYINYPGIWLAIVGYTGTNKSEPLKVCFDPIKDFDNQLFEEYECQMEAYENYMQLSAAAKKNAEKVVEPILRTHVIDDITIETLNDCFRGNEHGLCSHVDELMTWVLDMERYGNKSVQSKFLSIWGNSDFSYLRKTQKMRIRKPFLNVIGGIQPEMLKLLAGGHRSSDGTLYRFLFCYPGYAKQGKPLGKIDERLITNYKTFLNKLLFKPFDFWEDSGLQTKARQVYIKEGQATRIFEEFNDNLRTRLNSLPECEERKFIAKLQIYLYRLTLLLHLIEHSVSDDEKIHLFINESTVKNATKLIDYFHQTALKVGNEIKNPTKEITEKELLIEIRQKTGHEYSKILDFMKSNIPEGTLRQWINRATKSK